MTLQLLSALLKASRPEQDRFYSRQLPLGVFKTHQAQAKWVYEYRDKHGVYPSQLAYNSRFSSEPLPRTREPLHTLVATLVDTDVFQQLSELVEKGKELHESGRAISDVAEFFRRASQDIRLYDMSFVDATLDPKVSLREYKDFIKRQRKGLVHAPSPWPTFNEIIGLFEPGELATIAARTSLGKTWLAIVWANYFESKGERVLFVSKELPSRQVSFRWSALRYRLSYPRLRKGKLLPLEMARWVRYSRMTSEKSNILISGHETTKGVGFGQIIQKIQEFSPTVLVVDGAYLIYPEERFNNDVQRFAFISSMLKRISMAYSLRTIAVVQAKREAESDSISGVTKAGITHIYGADTWAQDSDLVLMLNGKRGSSVRTVSLEKAREGEIGSWTINFKLHPYPDLCEVTGGQPTSNKVRFAGI